MMDCVDEYEIMNYLGKCFIRASKKSRSVGASADRLQICFYKYFRTSAGADRSIVSDIV